MTAQVGEPTGSCTARAQVGQPAPNFKVTATVGSEFRDVSLSDYRGKNVVLFFWPLDFTFVCPTEIVAFNDRYKDFKERNTEVLGASVDSQFTHLAWQKTPQKQGGLGPISFPMLADTTHQLARDYGVLKEDAGIAYRGLFLIDTTGVVRHMVINDLPLGRSVDEALRMVDALAHFEKHGEVCPANWKPGQKAMKAGPEASKEFFQQWGKA
jgi:alkyl hydroperoxide reductase subunit AhpC